MPDSPWIGSSRTAAVSAVTAAASAAASFRGTTLKPGTSGANGACFDSCGVADSAPIVRPWKPPSMHHELAAGAALARELERALDRLGAGVAQEHPAAEREVGQPLRQPHARLRVEEIPHVHQPAGLLAHRVDHRRVAVAELRDRDAREEVEVLVALVVPQARALAPHELDGIPGVGGHERVALERLKLR